MRYSGKRAPDHNFLPLPPVYIHEGNTKMTRYLLAMALLTATAAHAQQEGPAPTQAVVTVDSKTPEAPTAANITIKVNNRDTPVSSLTPITPDGTQVALLMDDGLRLGIGREIGAIRAFINNFPPGVEVFAGYMQNGIVVPAGDVATFSTDHAAIAKTIHLPSGIAYSSASPYFCLSQFVKNWPGDPETQTGPQPAPRRKARFILMITNGVDNYNGSTSVLNQDSPYVASTIVDAQRAGVPVYSIFFDDQGFRRNGSGQNFSGQNYLTQLAEGTGGVNLWQGFGNPVSTDPFLAQFQKAVAQSYVVTFPVGGNRNLERFKVSTNMKKTKLRAPELVRPGTVILSQ